MKKIIIQSSLIFCAIYTAATIFSSSVQLLQGIEHDTNTHILDRGVITLIGTITLQLIRYTKFRIKLLNIVLPYCASMGLVFLYVFISGFFEELHPNAYRDIFLNYTAAFIVIIAVFKIAEFIKNKQRRN